MQRMILVLIVAASTFARPAPAQIVINSVSGSGAAGIASTPIWDITWATS